MSAKDKNAQIKPHIMQRIKRIAVLSLLGVFLGTALAWHQENAQINAARDLASIAPAAGAATVASAMTIGGDYTLVDQDGKNVTNKDFQGVYKLVFFGFTYCPDICPTELRKMAVALNALGDDAKRIQPVFISTDPGRDTPAVMKDYVGLYHPQLIGLTGSQEQIDHVKTLFKVFAAKIEDPEATEYTMNHSSFTYFMGPDDSLLGVFRSEDSAETMISEIKTAIGAI